MIVSLDNFVVNCADLIEEIAQGWNGYFDILVYWVGVALDYYFPVVKTYFESNIRMARLNQTFPYSQVYSKSSSNVSFEDEIENLPSQQRHSGRIHYSSNQKKAKNVFTTQSDNTKPTFHQNRYLWTEIDLNQNTIAIYVFVFANKTCTIDFDYDKAKFLSFLIVIL